MNARREYIKYYSELCPHEPKWVHEHLADERIGLENKARLPDGDPLSRFVVHVEDQDGDVCVGLDSALDAIKYALKAKATKVQIKPFGKS